MGDTGSATVGSTSVEGNGETIETVGNATVGGSKVGLTGWGLDGEVIGDLIRLSMTPSSAELAFRVDKAQERRLSSYLGNEGKLDRMVYSNGEFKTIDRSIDGNTISLDPPNSMLGPLSRDETYFIADSNKRVADQTGDQTEFTLSLVLENERTKDDPGAQRRSTRASDEWAFDLSQGDKLTTTRVSSEKSQSGSDGIFSDSITAYFTDLQTRLFIQNVSRIDSVETREVPDGSNFLEDNSPQGRNVIDVTTPDGGSNFFTPDTYVCGGWQAVWFNDAYYEVTMSLSVKQ